MVHSAKVNAVPLCIQAMNAQRKRGNKSYCLYTKEGYVLKARSTSKMMRLSDFITSNLALLVHSSSAQDDGFSADASTCLLLDWNPQTNELTPEELLKMINEKKGEVGLKKACESLGFPHALMYYDGKEVFIKKDLVGGKPLWYGRSSTLTAVSSEKKALWSLGLEAVPLQPGKYYSYDFKSLSELRVSDRFNEKNQYFDDYESKKRVMRELMNSVKNGLLLDGDMAKTCAVLMFDASASSMLIQALLSCGVKVVGFVSGTPGCERVKHARKLSQDLGVRLVIHNLNKENVSELAKEVIELIETPNPARVIHGIRLLACAKKIKEEGIRVVFSCLGSDEVFARHNEYKELVPHWREVQRQAWRDLKNLWRKELYDEEVIMTNNNLVLRTPFLDKEFINIMMRVHPCFKLDRSERGLQRGVMKELRAPVITLEREENTRVMNLLKENGKRMGFKRVKEYLNHFFLEKYGKGIYKVVNLA